MTLTQEEINKMRDKRINKYIEFDLTKEFDFNLLDISKIEIKGDQAFWLEKKGESVNFQKCPCDLETNCFLLIVFNKDTIIENNHIYLNEGLKELQKYVKLSEYVNIYLDSESKIIEIILVSNSFMYTHEYVHTIKKDHNRVELYNYHKTEIDNFKEVLINWYAHKNSYYEYFLNEIHYYGNSPIGDEDIKKEDFFNYIIDMFEIDEVTREDFSEFLKELKN